LAAEIPSLLAGPRALSVLLLALLQSPSLLSFHLSSFAAENEDLACRDPLHAGRAGCHFGLTALNLDLEAA